MSIPPAEHDNDDDVRDTDDDDDYRAEAVGRRVA